MKLVSLKMSKNKAKNQDSIAYEESQYPYGFRLDVNSDLIDKFPNLKKVKAGSKVTIHAVANVDSVHITDEDGQPKKKSVNIQIQKINFSHSNSAKEAFDEYAE